MKKHLLTLISCALFYGISLAQEAPHPCGTQPYKSAFLKKYQANPTAYNTRTGDVLMVPMTIHNIGTDSGSGQFKLDKILDAMCVLNTDFEGTDIQFYIEGDIIYHQNSAYYNHETVVEGAYMMFDNNIENTINNYICADPAGNCGYNLPYAGIALRKSCAGPGDHTWSHEVGHNLSLPHPFIGWEGGVSHDGSISHSYSQPAPDTVYIDYTNFQSEFFVDTLIVDTLLVEYLDGSNCNVAADGFCDTEADYLNYRWACDTSTGLSTVVQTDPSGATFTSDGSLFMSYAFDECSNRFTAEQIAAMRATLINEKPELLYDPVGPALVAEAPTLQYPLEDEVVPYDELTLEWAALENATTYFVQVSRLSDFSLIVHEEVTAANSTTATDLFIDKNYYWRVRGYNNKSFCAPVSETIKFTTGDFVSNEDISLSNFKIFPTILHAGMQINIEWSEPMSDQMKVQIFNSTGASIYQNQLMSAGKQSTLIETESIPAGVYFIDINVDGKTERGKFVIY